MSYLKKNVNAFMILLLITVLVALVGVTVYFQITYRDLSGAYEDKVEKLDDISARVTTQASELNRTRTTLRIQEEDTEQYEELYGDLSDENIKITLDLASVRNELTQAIRDLGQARNDITNKDAEIAAKKSQISRLNNEIEDLERDVNILDDDRDDLCAILETNLIDSEGIC